ncbi:Phytocyanin domain-containing protein [Heracleum sosnowskyi]|uniref:Phytocyanin domain-containing protein n=1 Tax=Heracleum sosnowskyi TaxID=360622 RepID=A0AAD8IJG7_9APIA|nr:Phytocyanin domain-containing protein [Heracleum sosnowskyi]
MKGWFSLFILLALSSSSIVMAARSHRHHPHHHHHGHVKSKDTVHFKPRIPIAPSSSIPWIVPAVNNVTWNFNVTGWPHSNITFQAGDILVFNYDHDLHNVVPVDEANYLNCSIPDLATVYTSGNDEIVLQPGTNYFICGTMGHCIAGMLIAVTAT